MTAFVLTDSDEDGLLLDAPGGSSVARVLEVAGHNQGP